MTEVGTILTSAVVGAAMSAVISQLGLLLERRAKRRELIFTRAIEIARDRRELAMRVAEKRPGEVAHLPNFILTIQGHMSVLDYLYEHGKLPDDWDKRLADGDPWIE